MHKKIFTSCVLLAFINYLLGCVVTKTEKAFKEELKVGEETIEQVVFPNADVVTFDENGGDFRVIEAGLRGTSIEGDEIIFPLEDIREFRTEKVPSIPIDEIGNRKITEVVLKSNGLQKFNDEGAEYNEQKNTITGMTEWDQPLTLATKNILEIHTEHAKTISKEEFIKNENLFVAQVVISYKKKLITFNAEGCTYIDRLAVISGITQEQKAVNIPTSEILYVKLLRVNAAGTVLANLGVLVGILGVAVLVALATKESCPFVYSFDGEQYVFDAEPLGGATTQGLQRSELSKLDFLKEVNNQYKIMVKNEVEETQYLDEMSLFITDYPPDYEVVSDLEGNLHAYKNPIKPTLAKDEQGLDLTKFIDKEDNIFWQTKLPVESYQLESKSRHELTFTFPKPFNKKSAKLIINAGTTLWGSNMIREMLLLYGDSIDEWYRSIDNSEIERERMMSFIEREELYLLKLWVKEADGWKVQNVIQGGGPFVIETRCYNLDLTNIEGDSLYIKLNPPFGFWTLDYIAIEYNSYKSPIINEVKMISAKDNFGTDVLKTLLTVDDIYFVMSSVGDYFIAEFEAPVFTENNKRTIFLKSNGYYEIHLPKDQPMQSKALYEIGFIPGKIVEYSNKLYKKWSNNIK